jgi:hypothetical protein
MPASVKLVTMLFQTTSRLPRRYPLADIVFRFKHHRPRGHYCVTVLLVVNGLIFPSGFTCQYFLNIGSIFFLSGLHFASSFMQCPSPRKSQLLTGILACRSA